MIKEIKNAITKRLKERFPECNIYTRFVEQGYKEPCFFVSTFPLSVQADNDTYNTERLNISIQYCTKLPVLDEYIDAAERIKNAFVLNPLRIDKTTNIQCYGADFEVQTGGMITTLTYEYVSCDRVDDTYTDGARELELGGI